MNCHGSLRPTRASLGPSSAGAGDRSTPGKFSSTGSSRSHVRLGRLAPSFRAFGIRPENWLCAEQLKLVAILSDVTASAAERGPLQFFLHEAAEMQRLFHICELAGAFTLASQRQELALPELDLWRSLEGRDWMLRRPHPDTDRAKANCKCKMR